MNLYLAPLLLGLLSVAVPLRAIDIVESGATGPHQVNLGGTYTQNFDSLLANSSPENIRWNDNVTLSGWYTGNAYYGGNLYSSLSGLSTYGSVTDRAFGGATALFALRLVNTTAQTITGFHISYTGEQWFRGASNPQFADGMSVYYIKYSSSTTLGYETYNIGGIGGVFIPQLRFFSPNATATTSAVLDGNAPENRTDISFFFTGTTLAPGEKIWFHWVSSDHPDFNDHVAAVDDFSIRFSTAPIPEPASAAALLGLAALASAATRRRSRS